MSPARLYSVTTFNLNKAVKRNLDRFPSDFMFQPTNQEDNGGHLKRLDALEEKYDCQFEIVFEAIRELMSQHTIPRKRIIELDHPDE